MEIAGCFAFWAWLRQGRGWPVALLGIASLIGFAVVLTKVDAPFAGRAYAAYGGVYIAASLVWLTAVEGQRPTATDIAGGAACRRRTRRHHRVRNGPVIIDTVADINPSSGRGYVMGFARAYRRSKVTLNAVRGAITVAKRRGLPDPDIAQALRGFGITWDTVSGELRVEPAPDGSADKNSE